MWLSIVNFISLKKNNYFIVFILVVQDHHDGLSGASLKTINDVFLKTQAIHRLNLKRRTLFRLIYVE